MFCRRCGKQLNDDEAYCAKCGTQVQPAEGFRQRESYEPGAVPDYLVWSILATLCCCLIPGVVAIVYAAQVNGKLASGDYNGALSASNSARTWTWWSFGLGLAGFILYIMMIAAGVVPGIGD